MKLKVHAFLRVGGFHEMVNMISYWKMIRSDFVHRVAETLLTRILLIGVGLITSVIVARSLGPEGRGLVAVAGVVAIFGAQFGNLGLHSSNTYYVAQDRNLLPALIGNSLATSFILGSAIGVGVEIFFYIRPDLAPVQGWLLTLSLLTIPFGLAYLLLQNLLLGIQEVGSYNKIELLTKSVGVSLLVLVIITNSANVITVFATSLLVLIIGLIWVFCSLQYHLTHRPFIDFSLFKKHLRYGFKSYVSSFLHVVMLRVDLLMIQYMLGEKQAGYYSVSASMADLIYMLPSVIGMILFPKLSSLKTKKEKWELTKKVTGIVFGVMMVLAGISTILCEPIVRILYGNKFLPAVPPFIWLMPGIVLYGSTFSPLFVLSIGQPRGVLFIWAFLVALNVMMNYYIIRIGGIVGAAIVSSITYGTCFVIYWVYAWRLSLDR